MESWSSYEGVDEEVYKLIDVLMMISKVNQIGFLSQVFKSLLTNLVRFMMVFWQPGHQTVGHGVILPELCWGNDPCILYTLASNAGVAGA